MTRKAPAFQFYVDDWLSGTFGMPYEQKGVYIDLLALQWSRGKITNQEVATIKLMSSPEVVDAVLASKFLLTDCGWINCRLEDVRNLSEIRKQSASKGGSKTQANVQANPQANGKAKFNPPTPTPTPTPISYPDPIPIETKERGKPAARPSVEEVRAYCVERDNKVDPEQFHDHYTANGWRQSNGNSIKDWQASVRTWEKRNGDFGDFATTTKPKMRILGE